MSKVKQKISGCFRQAKNAQGYCRIRKLIATAKKNGKNIFKTIKRVVTVNAITKSIIAN